MINPLFAKPPLNRTVLISGGTGMIGKRLIKLLLDKDYKVIILTRNPPYLPNDSSAPISNLRTDKIYVRWDIEKGIIDKNAVSKADYIIHLAGAGVADKRWSSKRKKEIIQSRTKSSALIVSALKDYENKVKAVISASAIGWYGADNDRSLKNGFIESDPPSNSFLGETCRLWEESIAPVEGLGKRLVKLRTGIVLSNDGGALNEFKKPLKVSVAAILGNGRQIISWIHIDDICRMYIAAMENENLSGAYNAVAPTPVTNKTFTLKLAEQMRGSFFISMHVPSFALKIGLGEMSTEVLKSATVSCSKIKETGFTFLYPSIEAALRELKEATITKKKT